MSIPVLGWYVGRHHFANSTPPNTTSREITEVARWKFIETESVNERTVSFSLLKLIRNRWTVHLRAKTTGQNDRAIKESGSLLLACTTNQQGASGWSTQRAKTLERATRNLHEAEPYGVESTTWTSASDTSETDTICIE